jgi:hypothetical protein
MKLPVQNCAQCAVKWLRAPNVICHCQFRVAKTLVIWQLSACTATSREPFVFLAREWVFLLCKFAVK